MKCKLYFASTVCLIVFFLSVNRAFAQADAVGMFDKHEDIGHE